MKRLQRGVAILPMELASEGNHGSELELKGPMLREASLSLSPVHPLHPKKQFRNCGHLISWSTKNCQDMLDETGRTKPILIESKSKRLGLWAKHPGVTGQRNPLRCALGGSCISRVRWTGSLIYLRS